MSALSTPAGASGRTTSASADALRGAGWLIHAATLALAAAVIAFVLWARAAALDEVAAGLGKVIPASKVQFVQNLEGGIVQKIFTAEGARVRAGDVLVQIDTTGFGSSLEERREKIAGYQALSARLEAELAKTPPVFPPEATERNPTLIAQHKSLYENRRREIDSALAALDGLAAQRRSEIGETESKAANLEKSLAIAREEREVTAPLVERGAAARVELLRLDARVNEIEGLLSAAQLALPRLRSALGEAEDRRREKESAYRSEAYAALNEAKVQLAALQQSIKGDTDKIDRADVRAPVDGIVKSLNVTTLGQVLRPGSDIIELVPLNDTLVVEAKIRPQDVAFIRPGQAAKVKISAYDYTIYGTLDAEVTRLSADSITDQKGEIYYTIAVRTRSNALERNGERLPIIPGMVAEVDVLTGRKTVLEYLMKPLTRMQAQAMRER